MCSIKITLNYADGNQQTFIRSAEKSGIEDRNASDLATLHKHLGEVQSEVNAALTVLVDKEKAANAAVGRQQNRKVSGDEEDDEDGEDDDDDGDSNEANGCGEPPEKIQKTC